jgi:hypothetical protein
VIFGRFDRHDQHDRDETTERDGLGMSEIARKPSYSPVNTPGQLFQRSSLSTPLSPNPRRRTPGRSASDGLQHKASSPTLFRETLKGSSKEVPMLEDSMEDLVACVRSPHTVCADHGSTACH